MIQALNSQAQASIASFEELTWRTFSGVFEALADTTPKHQGCLLDFLTQLRQTTVTDAEGKPVEIDDGEVWTDLPRFGWVARDCWNFGRLAETLCPRDRARAGVGTGFVGGRGSMKTGGRFGRTS